MFYNARERFLRSILGDEAYAEYSGFRLFIFCVVQLPLIVFALIGFVWLLCYWPIHELRMESNYRQKYGAEWETEFERYHGSLKHAHFQIAVCVFSLIVLALIAGYWIRVFIRRRRQRRA
jgi:hypothetical protein